jgi:hypothetical protein
MTTSGVLVTKAAAALGMDEGVVSTTLKSLRAHRMISMKGRGKNAAEMTPEDVAALLAGIATGAGTADIPAIARILLDMPSRYEVRRDNPIGRLVNNPLNRLRPGDPFSQGLAALLGEEIEPERNEWGEQDASNPLTASARVVIGLDGKKQHGFGAIRGLVGGSPVYFYYSDLPKWRDVEPGSTPAELGLELYQNPPPFVMAVTIHGGALRALAKAVAPDPTH